MPWDFRPFQVLPERSTVLRAVLGEVMRMWRKAFMAVALGALLPLVACGGGGGTQPSEGGQVTVPPATSPTVGEATSNTIQVAIGEADPTQMYMHLSQASATAGTVTFVATNEGQRKHEFIVLKTDTAAADLPIVTFEGESDRIDEEAAGVEAVGEIEEDDLGPGASATLNVDLEPGHYVLLCNLKGHYRMGMRQDFQVS